MSIKSEINPPMTSPIQYGIFPIMDAQAILDRIKQRLEALQMTPNKASVLAGVDRSFIRALSSDIAAGKKRTPRENLIRKFAPILECNAEWLLHGTGSWDTPSHHAPLNAAPTQSPPEKQASKAPVANVDMTTIRTGGLVGENGFPIYASAQGGPTGMTLSFEPIEHAKWPEPLIGVKGGFGMYVVGDSMEPAYWQGDMILVHPTKPARNGDDVLVVKSNGNGEHAAMVKRLVKGGGDEIVVKQYNPGNEFPIPRSEIHGVYLIVGSYKRR